MKNPALSSDLARNLRDANPTLFPTRWKPKRLRGWTGYAPSRRQKLRMGIQLSDISPRPWPIYGRFKRGMP